MNVYCDNYATCNAVVMDRGGVEVTVAVARARGWHLYAGSSMTGKKLDVVLCEACVGSVRRRLPVAGVLEGQLELELDGHEEAP